MADGCASLFITTNDGLRLHVSSYGARTAEAMPVVCLPGLARTGADFDRLAKALSADAARPRYVVALDYRGRGRSDYDRKALNYNFVTELADLLAVLTALDLDPQQVRRPRSRPRGVLQGPAGAPGVSRRQLIQDLADEDRAEHRPRPRSGGVCGYFARRHLGDATRLGAPDRDCGRCPQ